MGARQKDGATARAHFEAAARMRGKGAEAARRALEAPTFPDAYRYLWSWFLELHGRRGSGAMGPARLSWPDLDAWARRTRRDPSPWEFGVLGRLDDVFFLVTHEQEG